MNPFSVRHLLALLVLICLGASPAWAQRPDGGPRMERLESARIAYITDKIALTQDQAQRFWPMYNEYTTKRRELRRQSRQGMRGQDFSAMSDKEIRTALDNQFKLRQTELNLEKDYADKFQKVISLRQVAQLMQAEREFTKALIKRLDGGSAGGPGTAPRGPQ